MQPLVLHCPGPDLGVPSRAHCDVWVLCLRPVHLLGNTPSHVERCLKIAFQMNPGTVSVSKQPPSNKAAKCSEPLEQVDAIPLVKCDPCMLIL